MSYIQVLNHRHKGKNEIHVEFKRMFFSVKGYKCLGVRGDIGNGISVFHQLLHGMGI